MPVQAVAAGPRALLPVLHPGAVQAHGRGVPHVGQAGGDLISCHLVVDFQGCQQDVPLRLRLWEEVRTKQQASTDSVYKHTELY